MREILFRAKREDNGVWVESDSIMQFDCDVFDDEYKNGGIKLWDKDGWVWVDKDTFGEFTGLMDKNGKRIFEGDILKTSNKNEPIWYVDYKLCSFCVNQRNVNYSCRLDEFEIETDLEVIGNIYDKPELLEA